MTALLIKLISIIYDSLNEFGFLFKANSNHIAGNAAEYDTDKNNTERHLNKIDAFEI